MLNLQLRKQLPQFSLDLVLTVEAGITALFGPSGAGKSMTMACIAGLDRADTGRIVLNDTVLFDAQMGINLPPQRRNVGYVMQDYLLFPHLTVAQNIAFGLTGINRAEKAKIVHEALQRVGLVGFEARRPAALSGGQQQRVALARVLVTQPQLLLLDEPFSALDGPTRSVLRRDLRALQRAVNLPTLLVTHDLAEAYLLADYIAVLHAGRVLQFGSPEMVVYRPANRLVAELTGGANFFSAQVVAHRPGETDLRIGDLMLTGPSTAIAVPETTSLTIRPERIMLIRKDIAVGPRENQAAGQIISELTDGFNHTLFFRLEDGRRLHPTADYDLEIVLPTYVYQRLQVCNHRHWAITIKREAIHIFE